MRKSAAVHVLLSLIDVDYATVNGLWPLLLER